MEETRNSIPNASAKVEKKLDEIQEFIQGLPKARSWSGNSICKYQGVWYPSTVIKPAISFQRHFQANDTDLILATMPKSGTTWLKALAYTTINRNKQSVDQSPLLTSNPHALVPFLDFNIYAEQENPELESIPSPRIFGAHLHYEALPDSILNSNCRIVYLCRNPLDRFISHWHFVAQNKPGGVPPLPVEEAFEFVLKGQEGFGPFWDHLLGYWKASIENPQKILFLQYEDLKKNTFSSVKKMAEFMGYPFTEDEEKNGLIEEIIKLCSLQNLRDTEINKTGETEAIYKLKNSSFFRKGEVGDWTNYLTPFMAEQAEKLIEEKLYGSGLVFDFKS